MFFLWLFGRNGYYIENCTCIQLTRDVNLTNNLFLYIRKPEEQREALWLGDVISTYRSVSPKVILSH